MPVESRPSDWSALNIGAGYEVDRRDSLVNNGKGTNYGLELTVEKPFATGYYVLSTVSAFQSNYKGSNGVQHHTVFNGHYVANILGGKEWKLKDKHTLAVDLKIKAAGGKRYSQLDVESSKASNKAVYREELSFTKKMRDYLRADIKLTYRMSGGRYMQEFHIDFQNVSNHKNMLREWYDTRTQLVRKQYQLGFTTNFNYRIQF